MAWNQPVYTGQITGSDFCASLNCSFGMGLTDAVAASFSAETDIDTADSDQVAGDSVCISTAWVTAAIVLGGSSSAHSLISNYSDSTSSGILDGASASLFSFPGLYLMVKWKSANSATHLEVVAFSFAVDKM